MAVQVFKDPYLFDFLGTDAPRRETELERGLMAHIQKFLLELGQGFAFVGQQVHLELGDHDFYLDLLFYHIKRPRGSSDNAYLSVYWILYVVSSLATKPHSFDCESQRQSVIHFYSTHPELQAE